METDIFTNLLCFWRKISKRLWRLCGFYVISGLFENQGTRKEMIYENCLGVKQRKRVSGEPTF